MPVIPTLNEAIKLGLDFTAMAPPMLVASLKTVAQVIMSAMALQPMGIIAIPVIPFGAAISLVIQMIEYLINFFFEITAKTIQKMVDLYAQQLAKAQAQRKAALKKLYDDEKEAQRKLREKRKAMETRLEEIPVEMDELQKYQEAELARYNATVFEYTTKAQQENAVGNEAGAQFWKDMISSLDEWLVNILLITIEIMNKRLEMWEIQRELPKIIPLCELALVKDWAFLEEWADDFEVPVPYYPDLPERPNLPSLPVLPKGNCITDKLKQMLGKWLTAPQVPPLGIAIGGILECIRHYAAPLPPPAAAKMESVTDSIALQLGMVI